MDEEKHLVFISCENLVPETEGEKEEPDPSIKRKIFWWRLDALMGLLYLYIVLHFPKKKMVSLAL